MATERVNLTLETRALAAARAAARAENLSLSEWLGRAAWERAVDQAAQRSAEQDRLAGEPTDWESAGADRVFGQDAA